MLAKGTNIKNTVRHFNDVGYPDLERMISPDREFIHAHPRHRRPELMNEKFNETAD